jgi:hypothetical protein
MTREGVTPDGPQDREEDPLARSLLWIRFPCAALQPVMTHRSHTLHCHSGAAQRSPTRRAAQGVEIHNHDASRMDEQRYASVCNASGYGFGALAGLAPE